MNLLDTNRFISFEGIDYSGKSTQIELLKEYLIRRNARVYVLREPGGTAISEKIRDILLDKKNNEMDKMAEIFLYSAARVQLTNEKIKPLLEQGYFVLADRYVDSTTAYQGYGRGIDPDLVRTINRAATCGIMPGLTIYMKLNPKLAAARRVKHGRDADRLEAAGIDFYKRVFEGYMEIARLNPDRIQIIDAEKPVGVIHEEIRRIIKL